MFTKIRFVIASITLATVVGLAGNEQPFHAKSVSEYAHQASENVTVGAKACDREDLTDLLKYLSWAEAL